MSFGCFPGIDLEEFATFSEGHWIIDELVEVPQHLLVHVLQCTCVASSPDCDKRVDRFKVVLGFEVGCLVTMDGVTANLPVLRHSHALSRSEGRVIFSNSCFLCGEENIGVAIGVEGGLSQTQDWEQLLAESDDWNGLASWRLRCVLLCEAEVGEGYGRAVWVSQVSHSRVPSPSSRPGDGLIRKSAHMGSGPNKFLSGDIRREVVRAVRLSRSAREGACCPSFRLLEKHVGKGFGRGGALSLCVAGDLRRGLECSWGREWWWQLLAGVGLEWRRGVGSGLERL